jgi:hypothetical protein
MLKITSPNEAEDASWLSFPLGFLPLALVESFRSLRPSVVGSVLLARPIEPGLHTRLAGRSHDGDKR